MTAPSGSERPKSMFGLKDVFTSLNCLGGIIAICLCIGAPDGTPRPFEASLAILLGWIADALDGQVARWTKTQNRFGGEYDTISDHLAHVIAPAAIVFTVFKSQPAALGVSPMVAWWVGLGLAGAMAVAGSVRHARNLVRPVSFKGIWCGLPRTLIGFLAIGYCNSVVLWQWTPGGGWIAAAICLASCWGTLTYVPFASHHLARKLGLVTRICVTICLVVTFGLVIVNRAVLFDVFLFMMLVYSVLGWAALTKEERAKWWELVAAAKARTDV